jgi:hypothetical protein
VARLFDGSCMDGTTHAVSEREQARSAIREQVTHL